MRAQTRVEFDWSFDIGVKRHEANLARGLRDKCGCEKVPPEKQRWQHGMGAAAEHCVSVATGLPWTGNVNGPKPGADVGNCIGVRWADLAHKKLILHPDDGDDLKFVLVLGSEYPLKIVGWCYGREGKAAEFWRDDLTKVRYPAFFVRPHRPISTITCECGYDVFMPRNGGYRCSKCGRPAPENATVAK